MRLTFCLILTFNFFALFGQRTGTFYYSPVGELCNSDIAKKKCVINALDDKNFKEEIYNRFEKEWSTPNYYNTYEFLTDSVIIIKTYVNNSLPSITKRIYKKINDSLFAFTDYYKDTVIRQMGEASNILPLILNGRVINYFKNGNISCKARYRNNRLISNQSWSESGEKDVENVFDFYQVEVEPQFNDGKLSEFIGKQISYPKEARKNNIAGRVVIQFIIMEDGSVERLKILKSMHPALDEEAIRVVKLTNKKWLPGIIDAIPVRVTFVLPILFSLD